MKIKHTLILFFCLISIAGSSQSIFKVLVNKGKNEMKVGSSWQAIKVGSALGKNDEIKIAPNSYLALVHVNTGKPLEVKEPGTQTVADLEKRIPSGTTSVLAKYTDFILSSNATPNSNLKATGAVHRGPQNINVYLPTVPSLTGVYGSRVIVTWDNETIKGPYVVTYNNNFDDELKKIETSGNTDEVDLTNTYFAPENYVRVKILSKSEGKVSPDQLGFRILSKSEKEKIKKLMDAELGTVPTDESALSKLILAGFYENQKLLVDAGTAYQQAIKLAPDVPDYKAAYEAFLLRTSLKEPKEKK